MNPRQSQLEAGLAPLTLYRLARRNAESQADRTAWCDELRGESLTHGQVYSLAIRALAGLRQWRIARGDVVCLIMKRTGAFSPYSSHAPRPGPSWRRRTPTCVTWSRPSKR